MEEKNIILAINAAITAGEEILKIYDRTFSVEYKEDKSPLTEADKASNSIICDQLAGTYPMISEENKTIDYEERKDWDTYWIIDPLDGTKEFIKHNGEFTVNIALVQRGTPILGVVYVPVSKKLYFSAKDLGSYSLILKEKGDFSEVEQLKTEAKKLPEYKEPDIFTIVASRSHLSKETEDFVAECRKKYGEVKLESKGSSLKLCMVAEGKAQVYPRLAPTMEWDTAAAHAVAKYAGCKVLNFESQNELQYNKENLLNPFFIVKR